MKKQWKTEKGKYPSKEQINFENLLKENGYEILGAKEYSTKTDYLITKDGTEIEHSIEHVGKDASKAHFSTLQRRFEVKREVEELRKILEERK